MNRRGFFGAIAGLVAGAELDPERLLWRPGKLISIPKPRKPALHHLYSAFEIPAGEVVLSLDEFTRRYVEPAAAAIRARLESEFRVVAFERLPLPEGLVRTAYVDEGPPKKRVTVAYDWMRPDPCYVGRVDCAFWGVDR